MPDSERRRRVEEICTAALDQDASARPEFLRHACGNDAELRRDVESLLAYETKVSGFLELPALDEAARNLGSNSGQSVVGRTLGPYAAECLLGAGGMGEVYAARDTRLVCRPT